MRNEQQMLDLILDTARGDERIRAVIMNGSRANPQTRGDIFQDFDIVYIVSDVSSFRADSAWINRFGEMMIMQMPDDMGHSPPPNNGRFAYLMQFADGNRIDLTLFPLAQLAELGQDSLSRLLLDKDGIIPPFSPTSDRDYLPNPPSAKAFADGCNEFWWIGPYVAKGLWREEILYARYMLDQIMRDELLQMLAWYVGVETQFSRNLGAGGKYLQRYLKPPLWEMLMRTFTTAGYEETWEGLETMCDLFQQTAVAVANHFGFIYPHEEAERVRAHLHHVRFLPKDATQIY